MDQPPTGPGVSRLICVASDEFPRYSEGDVIQLNDGRLLLAVGRKAGASDFAPGVIIGMFSSDDGHTWDDEPHVILDLFDDLTDLMSVSFCRSDRGVHMVFLARGPDMRSDTRVYQIISTDEGRTWSTPQRISGRDGYHVVNNARVVRLASGRMIIPSAFVPGNIHELYDQQRVICFLSDNDGQTWSESEHLILENVALMEPGVAPCADGTLYMTIRTKLGVLYEARSHDDGETWKDLRASPLPAPAAPSTVTRDPHSHALWMIWCNIPKATWKQRSRQVFAVSHDQGRTWSEPRIIEDDPQRSFGYFSVTIVGQHALLTYYDWLNRGQASFSMTSLRQRMIPLAWMRGEVVPPVFVKEPDPVLTSDNMASMNSGLIVHEGLWKLWYTTGRAGAKSETLRIAYAESRDQGRTWDKPLAADATNLVQLPHENVNAYHPSVHLEDGRFVAYIWRSGEGMNGLYRYISDDGRVFRAEPHTPVIVSPWASDEQKALAGEGRVSNDAFDVAQNPDGTYDYFAACMVKASDPRTIIKHDNAAGWLRYIGRATSHDGIDFSQTEIIIEPNHDIGDPFDTQFYAMQVFRYRSFYLGLLQTYRVQSQIIQPEWAWSHDAMNWVRSRTPCISLGDEGAFDSRMILFGDVVLLDDQIVWMYSGYDWRHHEHALREVGASIGRATMRLAELDAWLATLPEP